MTPHPPILILVLVMGVLLTSCGTTSEIKGTWVDEDYVGGELNDFLVIGVSDSTEIRKAFEEALVQELGKKGVRATPSISVMPTNELISEETINAAIEGKKIDAVIITRLVSRDTALVTTPETEIEVEDPYNERFYMYYDRSHKETREPTYLMGDVTVTLETNVWETDGGGLIWSGLSQSFNPRNAYEVIGSVSREIVKKLEANGILGSP
jgi:hypothetical protein